MGRSTRAGRRAGLALLALLSLGACVDERELLREVEACSAAAARLGPPLRVSSSVSMVSAGVWMPPTTGCTHKARVAGSRGEAELYFTRGGGPCHHLVRHTGQMRDLGGGASSAIFELTDLGTCTTTEQ